MMWRTLDGALLHTLEGHRDAINSCSFSPDGGRVLSASGDKTLKLWRAADGALERTLEGHSDVVWGCCFSPNGAHMLSASADRALKLWRVQDCALERTLKGHKGAVLSCCFSPDSARALSASEDKTLKLWRIRDGTLERTLEGHTDTVRTCCFSPDGAWALSGSDDRALKLWDVQDYPASDAPRLTYEQLAQSARWLHAAHLPRLSHYLEYRIEQLPAEAPFAELLSQLLVGTATSHRESYSSRTYCEPPKVEVLGVRDVVNPRLQRQYLAKLENLEGKRRSGCTPIPALKHLKLPVGRLDSDLNEHLLFHGAPWSVLEQICKGGFNPQRGGETTGKLFGVASYFAANSSKADDYTEERSHPLPKSAKRTIVVARVALGEALRVTQPTPQATRPPDGQDCLELDAVWADSRGEGGCVDHIEVMVYSEAQALPIALVDYRHTPSCWCAFCRRRPAGQ